MKTLQHKYRRTVAFVAVFCFTLAAAGSSVLAAVTITEYPNTMTANSSPHHSVLGPDGNMWFTEFDPSGKIGVMSASGTMIAEHTLAANAHPNDIAVGPDNNIWFTEYASPGGTAAIGRLTTSGTLNEFTLSPSTARPHAVVAAPDGNLWFTQLGTQVVGRIKTDGTIVTPGIALSGTCSGTCQPYGMAVGPDNNIWFTEWTDNKIVKMDLSGTILASYPITGGRERPYEIVAGNDGKLWFTMQQESGSTGRAFASITTTGSIQYYQTPTPASGPHGIIAGPDGNIWIAENATGKIAMLAPGSGQITEYTIPTVPSSPFGLALGPNNTLWFGESSTTANGMGVISGLTIPGSGSAGSGTPQAPSTGYGEYVPQQPFTLVYYGAAAALCFGLAWWTRRLVGHEVGVQPAQKKTNS
jgi:streptogramin lyase